jgi:SAM-dependent methyltransferase
MYARACDPRTCVKSHHPAREFVMAVLMARAFKRIARSVHAASRVLMGTAGSLPGATSTSGHFYPYFEATSRRVSSLREEPPEISPVDGLPVPPEALRVGYGIDTDQYLASGRDHYQEMMRILEGSDFALEERDRVLDFGCASGRMIRCFKGLADRHEIWGVDIRAEHIFWCQKYLTPPFRFATTTTHPHLPFEDNSFNLIYACSVFTHIGDLEDSWLLELRRVLRPNGRLFATVHDNHAIDVVFASPPGHWLHDSSLRHQVDDLESRDGIVRSGFRMASVTIEPGNHQMFHDREFLRHRWGQFFTIHSFHPEAYEYQTAVVMSK